MGKKKEEEEGDWIREPEYQTPHREGRHEGDEWKRRRKNSSEQPKLGSRPSDDVMRGNLGNF